MKPTYYVGDFETTVYQDQIDTEVWASALVEFGTEDVKIFHSIDETFEYMVSLKKKMVVYYHNLKFDGSFWIDFLMRKMKYKQAVNSDGESIEFVDMYKMEKGSFRYTISNMGQWYSVVIRTTENHFIELRDSLKLLPFSVKAIGKSFDTKHKKLDMEYKGYRYAGCEITSEEQKYIANDVLVVKEALEILFSEGHNRLTIGSCALQEFWKSNIVDEYGVPLIIPKPSSKQTNADTDFPDLYQIESKELGCSVGEMIRKSYRGGWCYAVPSKRNKILANGCTADVNSLYPSMMHSESGNYFPVGIPRIYHNYHSDSQDKKLRSYYGFEKHIKEMSDPTWKHSFYFVHFRCRFKIKKGMLPFVQVKGSFLYRGNTCLETSDIQDPKTGKYYSYYKSLEGEIKPATVEMCMTQTDWVLFNEHYHVFDLQVYNVLVFNAVKCLFDDYIDKYKKMKQESTGARRALAKLFLNSLYGKMASSKNSSFKFAEMDEDGNISFVTVTEEKKKPGYIPIGSAITSYARNFTIRAAQKNYHGEGRGFIYADTDSIHCDLLPSEIKGITVHPTDFCCWKLESSWDKGIFVRQKTYIEHVIEEDCEPCTPYYNVRCAGMPENCKELFIKSITGDYNIDEIEDEKEKEFLSVPHSLTDFKIGLQVPGKLLPKRIFGGIVLVDTDYTMREGFLF